MCGERSPLAADRAPSVPGVRALLDAIRSDTPLARWLEINCPQPEKRQHPSFVADLVAAVCFDALVAGQSPPGAVAGWTFGGGQRGEGALVEPWGARL